MSDTKENLKRWSEAWARATLTIEEEKKARLRAAELELQNTREELNRLKADTSIQIGRVHRQIQTTIETITARIKLFKASKNRLDLFLVKNADPKAGNLDKRILVNHHYDIAQGLALAQHEYLSKTLELLALRFEVNPAQLKVFEEQYFVDCTNYDTFVAMSEVVLR